MEQALRPRGLNTPDVIKSAIDPKNEIDNLFGVPEKITIPERYVPEQVRLLKSFFCGQFFF